MKLRKKTITANTKEKSYKYTSYEVTVPHEHMMNLGWKKGDILICTSNQEEDTITYKRVKQEEEGNVNNR